MAYVEYMSGKKQNISAEQGSRLWEALCAPELADDKQLAYMKSVKTLWLNWHTAPDDYIAANLEWIIPMAVNEWIVDSKGKPTKPQTTEAWDFAKKWGLYASGITFLATHPAAVTHTQVTH